MPSVARRGLIGIPAFTNLFWVYALAALCVYVVWTDW